MNLDRGRVEREGLNLDAHDLLSLQPFEDAVQNTILGPAIHARINTVPFAEAWRKTAPFTALLGHKQNCVQHFKVLKCHIPALNRQAILDLFVLLGCDLH